MNTAAKVDQLMKEWKAEGVAKTVFVVRLANACIGWSYVFGARGEYCTPANRRRYYNAKGKPTIKSNCKNFEGTGSCSGCKWYPGGTTRFYDCRGFTYWLFLQIGITINGAGATSQWNTNANWSEKGEIENMPKDKICCVFRANGSTMEHTLFYDGEGHYIHCSGEVKKQNISSYKATHYAIPKGLYDEPTPPSPDPKPDPGKAIVTGKNVALRQGPSTSTTVQLRVATGTVVNLAEVKGWTYVKYGNKNGFMMNDFIDINNTYVKVTGKNVALREGTSTSSKVLTRIPTGTTVQRDSIPETWQYVSYNGKQGFMMKEFLKL